MLPEFSRYTENVRIGTGEGFAGKSPEVTLGLLIGGLQELQDAMRYIPNTRNNPPMINAYLFMVPFNLQ